MKQFILAFLLILLSFPALSQKKYSSDWILIYYMPYDNNLSYLGDAILEMIQDGIHSEKVMAVVQSDFSDSTGMHRYIIQKNTTLKLDISDEFSALTDTYHKYMDWVSENFTFRKSAIIFLDHGGKLDQIALDEWPVRSFLSVDSVNTVLEKFNRTQNKKIDLLFLQVCTKGALEPLYEFKNTVQYTLASQSILGAPNHYYTRLLDTLSKNVEINGMQLARLITEYETEDMYNSYTCIDNSKFEDFKMKFSAFLQAISQVESFIFQPVPIMDYYAGESYWDVISMLDNLVVSDSLTLQKLNDLKHFIENELIVIHQRNPQIKKIAKFSGLSISPLDKNIFKRIENYKHLRFFKDFDFTGLKPH